RQGVTAGRGPGDAGRHADIVAVLGQVVVVAGWAGVFLDRLGANLTATGLAAGHLAGDLAAWRSAPAGGTTGPRLVGGLAGRGGPGRRSAGRGRPDRSLRPASAPGSGGQSGASPPRCSPAARSPPSGRGGPAGPDRGSWRW